MTQAEFSGIRSQYYREIMEEMPQSRYAEREMLMKYLDPKIGEKILEVGAGTGFYSQYIAQRVFPGIVVATDPSAEQLMNIPYEQNIKIVVAGADTFPIGENPLQPSSFDAIWAFGCFHHIPGKTKAFKNLNALLKPGGRLIISDVYAGSNLARHFDLQVAKYCVTGHEVSFLSKEFADSLCFLTGFEKPSFSDANLPLNFDKMDDIGRFIYKIHAMTGTTPEECLRQVSTFLDIDYKDGMYTLIWPHVVLSTKKGVYK